MTLSKTLYLANPYGFSAQQREGPLPALKAALEAYWYGSVEEIANPGKELARWLKDGAAAVDRPHVR